MSDVKIRRALLSVSDKAGLVPFARSLQKWNIEIISTGGTLRTLQEAGIPARSVSDVTGFPEILDGRVKTLHPRIHAGILAVNDNPAHQLQMTEHLIEPIDMVVVNLYPFEETISRDGITTEEAIEQIDIGGPAMVRAAAKNFQHKVVVVNPASYEVVLANLEEHDGAISEQLRFKLATDAFGHTAQYDKVIEAFFSTHSKSEEGNSKFPSALSISPNKAADLRYGENPHQSAALYGDFFSYFEVLYGKELSYNNILDIEAASGLAEEFSEPTVVIVKHTNPCGVGSAAGIAEAYAKALATDRTSAFGGIIAINRPLDLDAAKAINEIFTEVVIAPEFPADVLEFMMKKKDRRLVAQKKSVRQSKPLDIRSVAGGVLVQNSDRLSMDSEKLRVVTHRAPSEEERRAMLFAWRVAMHVKSNAIVYATSDRTVGIGAGQMSRVDSSRLAVRKAVEAGLDLHGTAVASDGFFPFADGLLEATKAGATAVIQPGGSVRDPEVIQAADDNNVAMIFTGIRHFKH